MKNNLITRYNPFELIDPFFDEFFAGESNSKFNQMMATDIVEFDDHYELKIDLPDIDKENIKLSLNDGYLTIEANKDETKENDKHAHFIRRERFFGSYNRSFYVGDDIKNEDIKANMNDGVLTLLLNKPTPVEKERSYIQID